MERALVLHLREPPARTHSSSRPRTAWKYSRRRTTACRMMWINFVLRMNLPPEDSAEDGLTPSTSLHYLLGLDYNEAALKDLLNYALDKPLNWWRMKGLDHLTFVGFINYLARQGNPPAKEAAAPPMAAEEAAATPVAADEAAAPPVAADEAATLPAVPDEAAAPAVAADEAVAPPEAADEAAVPPEVADESAAPPEAAVDAAVPRS
ncbi:atherin-like [Sinocyclocheilus anshuiensis]|uniref:atherin-like n=1 Tax=Sinocyclocheilus anshuiensis TaxID=1608454 RepID=UPI0007B80748|nr:PREDICTED: atherin-like [Sinocyclocheilus anshuiensis]XP_016331130.1 PREDICTED: atherin-like [Sinocyclocheilus anshuiensis]